MERAVIIKALECHPQEMICAIVENKRTHFVTNATVLSLIKELTEENEKLTINMNAYGLTAKRLAEENAEQDKAIINALNRIKEVRQETKADTVKKMQEGLKAVAYQSSDWSHGEHPMVVEVDDIDEITEEMLEGTDERE